MQLVTSANYKPRELWKAFEDYICRPYAKGSFHHASMEKWHRELFARNQARSDLCLAFDTVEHEINGRKFDAFCLNEQMYFSDDPAVLTIPYPRSTKDVKDVVFPDQLVGVWLHDFGFSDALADLCKGKFIELKKRNSIELKLGGDSIDAQLESYLMGVVNHIANALNDEDFPGDQANRIGSCELRLAYDKPRATGWHRDGSLGNKMMWARSIIHPLMGSGTDYALDGNDCFDYAHNTKIQPIIDVSSPVGGVSSHCVMRMGQQWGVAHQARGCMDGRVILIEPDRLKENPLWQPVIDKKTPWRSIRKALRI